MGLVLGAAFVAAAATVGVASGQDSAGGLPAQGFVTVNGVRLHYADWGGDGSWLVFLTPGGGSLDEQFGSLAPQFADHFRVVGPSPGVANRLPPSQ